MANKNFKARIGIEAPLIAADNGTTAITLSDNDVTVVGDLTVTSNTIKSSSATAITLSGTDVIVAGDLRLNGNDILSSTGAGAISLSGADVGIQGDLFVLGNDIKSSTFATAITLSGSDVIVAGDLAVNGGDITTSQTTATLFDTTATTVNIGGAATTMSIGNASGTVTIPGNLTVNGTTTNINTQNLLVEDKNITIGDVATPTDVTAAGGGITLLGATNKTITWNNSTAGWEFNQNITTSGTLDVQGGTITDSTGALQITTASNGNLTLAPNGTGDIVLTLGNGGNLTNSRNYVFGAIRNATTESNGDIWSLNAGSNTTPTRGISIDNSADTAKTASMVARTYGAGAGNRSRFIFERARGTAASPTAVQSGDLLGEIDVSGYTSTGWINDTLTVVPGFFGFTATESWTSNTNLGTSFGLSLAPSGTTISSATSLVPTIQSNPQSNYLRADRVAIAQGKTSGFAATGCSVSGTTLTIGTLTSGTIAVGQALTFSTATATGIYIIANISGSGSGSTWQLSETPGTLSSQSVSGHAGFIGGPTAATSVDALQNLRLITNNIQGSTGTSQITTSAAGATLELRGDTVYIEKADGTVYATFNNNEVLFARPVRTSVTTGTVAQGGTFTPAATANNSIIVEITAGAGTTTIDVNNLTVAGENGIYDILVYNNSGGSINANGLLLINGAGNTVLDHAGTIANGARALFEVNCIDIYAAASFMSTAV